MSLLYLALSNIGRRLADWAEWQLSDTHERPIVETVREAWGR